MHLASRRPPSENELRWIPNLTPFGFWCQSGWLSPEFKPRAALPFREPELVLRLLGTQRVGGAIPGGGSTGILEVMVAAGRVHGARGQWRLRAVSIH